jgi:hypothetical protein
MRFYTGTRSAFALVWLAVVCQGLAHAQPAQAPTAAGHARALLPQRTATAPVIDGVLDEPVWQSGGVAETFWVSDLQRAPDDQTKVVVLYDDHAIYFAFTCFDDRPDLIRAMQVTRDAAPGLDDRVSIELDPFHNHRFISRFTVTARGTASDAIAGRSRKLEQKGAWSAAAQRTPFGWTAEIAVPLELLEYEAGTETFGINFIRYQNRTKEWSEWANVTPRRLPEEAGHLTGLQLPSSPGGTRMALVQYVSSAAGKDLGGTRSGFDLRYQWRRALTTVVSARPDFSGIDVEAPTIGFSYNEKFVSDHRPFFQEGAVFFGDRELFHSGRVDSFDVGVKTFGRVADYQVGILATTDADKGRTDYVSHVVREIGPAFNVSATLAGTARDTIDSNTVQLQAGGRLGRNVRVKGNIAQSASERGAGAGRRGRGEIAYEASHFYSGGWADRTDDAYAPANGFLAADLLGTTGRGAYGGYTDAFSGSWLRRADASVSYDARTTSTGLVQRETASIYAGAETATNIQLNAGMTRGVYRPRGGAVGSWTNTLNDDRYYLASAFYQSPTGQFGYGAQYSWGVAGTQDYDNLAPSLWLSPTSQFSFAYSFERATQDRVLHQHVVSGTWAISSEQSLAARWVDHDGGYYRVSYRRSLGPGVDAFGVYTSDPYDPGRLNMKVVWSWLPFRRRP